MRTKLIKSEFAKLFNITKAAIRYYEDKQIISPKKDENGYNIYDWNDVERLDKIIFLKNLGVKIDDIKKYINYESEASELLKDKRNELDKEINRLISTRNRIDNILSINDDENTSLNNVNMIHMKQRSYFIVNSVSPFNIKDFYESVSDLCDVVSSINEVFILYHEKYNHNNKSFENSKMLLPYNKNIKNDNIHKISFEEGKYLVIDYIYKDIDNFSIAYDKVIEYANEHNISIDKTSFVELEYKDYGILNKEKLYQLQFKVIQK